VTLRRARLRPASARSGRVSFRCLRGITWTESSISSVWSWSCSSSCRSSVCG